MSNNKFMSTKVVFQVATILSAMMLAASAMTSLVPTEVFAEEEASDTNNLVTQLIGDSSTQEETSSDGLEVDSAVSTAVNVDADVDVIFDEKDCEGASDQTNQRIEETSDQQSEAGLGVLSSVQTGANIAVTPDVVLTDKCDPTDQTSQEIVQDANQQGEGDLITTSLQDGRNYALDPNVTARLPT